MRSKTLLLTVSALAFGLTGCGTVDLNDIAPAQYTAKTTSAEITNSDFAPCTPPTTAGASKFSVEGVPAEALSTRAQSILSDRTLVALGMNGDPVVKAMLGSAVRQAMVAETLVRSRTTALDVARLDSAAPAPDGLRPEDFKNFAEHIARSVLDPSISHSAAAASSPDSFGSSLVSYYQAYYSGKFVDRFGGKFAAPEVTLTISNDAISNSIAVFEELLLDYLFKTPVWKDSSSKYYPAGTADEPTAASAGLVSSLDLLTEDQSFTCGITPLKAQAISYLSHAAGAKAALLGGLVSGSFGGFEVGLGFLGKFSFGDNQTLQTVVKASLTRMGERTAEEASYRILSKVGYDSKQVTTLVSIIQHLSGGN
jgi:hypothetical protein